LTTVLTDTGIHRAYRIRPRAASTSIRTDVPRPSSAETMATSSFHNVGGTVLAS
jgi:hypothetical protein